MDESTVYSAAFIFEPGDYDERFHELNDLIDEAANATDGFLGAESWYSKDGATINATYYWSTLDALATFSRHPKHLEAKREYQRWYKAYHVVVSQVLRAYGDGRLEHITPNSRDRSQKTK